MSGSVLPRSILQAVGTSGLGRCVPQLQRLTIKFCKSRIDSRGMRDYIEQHLVDYARRNPATVIYVKPRRHRPPLLVAEYLCGNWQYVKASAMNSEEVFNWMEMLRNRSGLDIMPIYKMWSTKSPSVQGMWHPFETDENQPPLSPEEIVQNLNQLVTDTTQSLDPCPTAEDQLLHIAKQQRLRSNE